MAWMQLNLQVPRERAAAVEDCLTRAGAVAVTLQGGGREELLEPAPGEQPLWELIEVTGLFEAGTNLSAVRGALAEVAPGVADLELLEERDWLHAWQAHAKPLRFGDRLAIYPSHLAPPADGPALLRLDPGLAFGSGTHPTTALCLEWLAGAELGGHGLLDYGCGSGILALAAARLGARPVYAVDHDPQALTAARANAQANGLADVVQVLEPRALPPLTADVLIANILANNLLELRAQLLTHLRSGGTLVLSGLLPEQAGAVAAAYADDIEWQQWTEREGWIRLVGVRRGAPGSSGATARCPHCDHATRIDAATGPAPGPARCAVCGRDFTALRPPDAAVPQQPARMGGLRADSGRGAHSCADGSARRHGVADADLAAAPEVQRIVYPVRRVPPGLRMPPPPRLTQLEFHGAATAWALLPPAWRSRYALFWNEEPPAAPPADWVTAQTDAAARRRILRIVTPVALALAVAGSGVLAWRADEHGNPGWRWAQFYLCRALDCAPPVLAAPQALAVLDSALVRNGQAGVADLSVRWVNRAPHPQPRPAVVIVWTDLTGQIIEQRRLPLRAAVAGADTLAAGEERSANWRLVGVPARASSYELRFEQQPAASP